MKKNNKVGAVIIMHKGQNNYGTSLQGFATLHVLRKLGYEYEIIRYNKKQSFLFLLSNIIGYIRSGGIQQYFYLRKKKQDLIKNPHYAETRAIREKAVNQFKKFFFESVSRYYNSYEELKEGAHSYRNIFVGSDQVWGPLSLYRGFYNLLFVDANIPTFSYASSFGVSHIFPWQKRKVAEFLNRLNYIGVREQRGAEIVKELTGKDATVVCDPTFLLSSAEWEECISQWNKHLGQERDYKLMEPYILTYILGEREDIRYQIKKLRMESGLPVVNLPHIDNYHKMDDNLGDIDLYDVDPFDFIRLVRNAEYVVTDSFHGSVFSILMHKKFVSFYRKKASEKGNTNSRIDSLFKLLEVSDRLYNGDIYNQMKAEIDYNIVDNKLSILREQSMSFFRKGLNL